MKSRLTDAENAWVHNTQNLAILAGNNVNCSLNNNNRSQELLYPANILGAYCDLSGSSGWSQSPCAKNVRWVYMSASRMQH